MVRFSVVPVGFLAQLKILVGMCIETSSVPNPSRYVGVDPLILSLV